MSDATNYGLALNLLNEARKSIANANTSLKLLEEGTSFNRILSSDHIISPDELTSILDKFAEQHPDWEVCIETDHGTVSEKFKMDHIFYEGMGDMIVLDFE